LAGSGPPFIFFIDKKRPQVFDWPAVKSPLSRRLGEEKPEEELTGNYCCFICIMVNGKVFYTLLEKYVIIRAKKRINSF
jgi:hypothetical protein